MLLSPKREKQGHTSLTAIGLANFLLRKTIVIRKTQLPLCLNKEESQ
jgi:hypothetical protein